jgi:hypothetical protein
MDGNRIVVPAGCRKKILRQLHLPHQGIAKTGELARASYFWVGMKNDIVLMCQNCELCTTFSKTLLEEEERMDPHLAKEPLDRVACDLFRFEGVQYLMVVNEFSNYGFHHKYRKTPCLEEVINVLETWFMQVGHAARIRSDGGPHFRSEFNA